MLEIRLMGTQEDVEEARTRLTEIFEIKSLSRTLPNRREPGVRCHLKVIPRARSATVRWVCRDCGSLDVEPGEHC